MTTRDELVGAGSQALFRDGLDAWSAMGVGAMAGRVVDAVEPLIRADEQEVVGARLLLGEVHRDGAREALADLRAKVQKLHEAPYPHIHYGGEPTGWRVALNAVLILLDQYGSSDE